MSNPSFVLRLEREGQSPTLLEFEQATITVGRETGDVVVGDPGASSKHAEILFADGIVKLRDVGSTNGTWLGTDKVESETMKPGVKFTIGTSTLELVEVKGIEPEAVATMVMAPPGARSQGPAGTAVQPANVPPATPAAKPAKDGPGLKTRVRGVGVQISKLPDDQKKKGSPKAAVAG